MLEAAPLSESSPAGDASRLAPRSVAFYLPQYHPIPENDAWWGPGFTEWTNVTRARPLFPGHYQPHLPAELGFYDLRLPETRSRQAELAARHGVSAFCYFHYWFCGRRLLERPFQEVLDSGQPALPFVLCWVNEDWTRGWDASNGEVLMAQTYGESDDLAHIRWLCRAFADPRYLRVDGRPVMLVYRASRLPDPLRTTGTWRAEAARLGLGDLHLVRVESYHEDPMDPAALGFDAATEFQPDFRLATMRMSTSNLARMAERAVALARRHSRVASYAELVERSLAQPQPAYRRYRCVVPSWDNSPRRGRSGFVFTGSSPTRFGRWLQAVLDGIAASGRDDSLLFVNAWNEWGEGNHLEPDQRHGLAYLEAHAEVLRRRPAPAPAPAGLS